VLNTIFKNPGPLFYAILVHIVLFAILTVSLDWSSESEEPVAPVNIVKATSVDEKKVQDQLNKLKKAEQDRIKKEQERQKKLEDEAKKAREQRQAEERKLREIEKKRLQEKRDLEKQKQVKNQELAKLDQQKKEKEKKLQDLQKKREAEEQARRLEQQKLQAAREEKKRLEVEAEKRRKAEEEELLRQQMLAEEQALRQDQMAAEEAKLAAENEKQAQSKVNEYRALIRQKIENNWRKPPSAKPGIVCKVKVFLIPGGSVRLVEIVKSSGDGIFDSTVDNAIRKADPLPLPPDPGLFDYFRELTFEFESTPKT